MHRRFTGASSTNFCIVLGILAMGIARCANAQELCIGYGPQSPRDISVRNGKNISAFSMAPAPSKMNLCNIHTHTSAEHKGPEFSVRDDEDEHQGWECNIRNELTEAELAPAIGSYGNVRTGDTIEVHWVYSTCDVMPGAGLESCFSYGCQNPQLRVESQVFLLVNDHTALDFSNYAYKGYSKEDLHQPKALPSDGSDPIVYAGSTTGNKYSQAHCSPFQVTWSVRPTCQKLDINSLIRWGTENIFSEHHSHGVRELVQAPMLLAPME